MALREPRRRVLPALLLDWHSFPGCKDLLAGLSRRCRPRDILHMWDTHELGDPPVEWAAVLLASLAALVLPARVFAVPVPVALVPIALAGAAPIPDFDCPLLDAPPGIHDLVVALVAVALAVAYAPARIALVLPILFSTAPLFVVPVRDRLLEAAIPALARVLAVLVRIDLAAAVPVFVPPLADVFAPRMDHVRLLGVQFPAMVQRLFGSAQTVPFAVARARTALVVSDRVRIVLVLPVAFFVPPPVVVPMHVRLHEATIPPRMALVGFARVRIVLVLPVLFSTPPLFVAPLRDRLPAVAEALAIDFVPTALAAVVLDGAPPPHGVPAPRKDPVRQPKVHSPPKVRRRAGSDRIVLAASALVLAALVPVAHVRIALVAAAAQVVPAVAYVLLPHVLIAHAAVALAAAVPAAAVLAAAVHAAVVVLAAVVLVADVRRVLAVLADVSPPVPIPSAALWCSACPRVA